MEQTLQAGHSIDTLTKRELREELKAVVDVLHRLAHPPTVIDTAANVSTDGSGNMAETEVYLVPTGREAILHRYHLATPASTPTAPIAQGWIAFYRDSATPTNLFMFLPPQGSTAVAPAIVVDGSDAKILRNGQRLVVKGAGLPASTEFSFSFQVRLWERARGQVL